MPDELEAREAVRQAYSAFYRRLVAALYALTGDYAEAQDLVQEAYARALARPKVFLDVADPEAWLRTVAVNLARTRWRRRRLFDTLVRTGRVTRTPESVPGADPNRVALVAALQQLTRPTREAIVLHHLADMSVYEVAESLGVPVGTVKARLSRGRTMLASLLNDHVDEPAEATREAAARETATRGTAAREAATRETATRETAAHQTAAREVTARALPAAAGPTVPDQRGSGETPSRPRRSPPADAPAAVQPALGGAHGADWRLGGGRG
ncbi:MAG TPA: RNA polymerase sigma factor [Rugosimonospora sp.]